ncbi:MAG: phytanoyl-CoA dioxygenase family protein [Pseudonocardia sp.]|nr:phytanoyl-CoA dioxygenase family protein [Pseudonocardia sp.]
MPSATQQLDELGYLVVEDILDPRRDLQPILDEYAEVLDRLADMLYAAGSIPDTYADLPFGPRLIQITREHGASLSQHFDISLPQAGIRSDTPMHLGPACFRLLTNPRLLDLAAELVGPDILVSPVGHVRIKLPEGTIENGDGQMAQIPWHQDNGVILSEADESNVLTVWVPINEATVDNGCMRVIPTARGGDLRDHCPSIRRGAHIPDRRIDDHDAVTLPMKRGSVLLMHPRTVHSSLGNTTTDQVRISMDLRYQPVGQPTGRPMFPPFVARSAAHPDTEMHDPERWADMWRNARARLAAEPPSAFNRWDANSPVCA